MLAPIGLGDCALAIAGEMAKAILIADDNPKIRQLLCQAFKTEEGYDVCAEASNGEEAIVLALRYRPDLIILDMSMPIKDGAAAARELKTIMPEIPIILFTQYGDLGKYLRGASLPVDRVVSKSDMEELMRHVRSLIPI
jgi:DNA-binding NarL/FixJ family response regulator